MSERTMDFGGGDANGWKEVFEGWSAKLTTGIAWFVTVAGGIWTIWKGSKFAYGRARHVWKTLNAFADSVDALRAINAELAVIKLERAIQTELSQTPFWKADANGNCVEANTAYCQLVGQSLEELRGAGWFEAIHPDDQEDVIRDWKSAVREVADFHRVYRLRSSAETIRVRVRAKPVRFADRVEFHGATVVLSRKQITAE